MPIEQWPFYDICKALSHCFAWEPFGVVGFLFLLYVVYRWCKSWLLGVAR